MLLIAYQVDHFSRYSSTIPTYFDKKKKQLKTLKKAKDWIYIQDFTILMCLEEPIRHLK